MTLRHLRPPTDVKSRTSYKIKCTVQQSVYFLNLNDRVLVKQGCDEYFCAWGISEKVHETTSGKRELHIINRSMVSFKGSIRYWNYLETCTDSVPADSRQSTLSVRNCVTL